MGFPGGCPQFQKLELFVGPIPKAAKRSLTDDDLRRPGDEAKLPAVSKRWRIDYDAPLSSFIDRARHLHFLLEQRQLPGGTSTKAGDE